MSPVGSAPGDIIFACAHLYIFDCDAALIG
jgi:hypothetical protein